jgi:hypothetical protein
MNRNWIRTNFYNRMKSVQSAILSVEMFTSKAKSLKATSHSFPILKSLGLLRHNVVGQMLVGISVLHLPVSLLILHLKQEGKISHVKCAISVIYNGFTLSTVLCRFYCKVLF